MRRGEAAIQEWLRNGRYAVASGICAAIVLTTPSVMADNVEQVTVTATKLPEAVGMPAFSSVTLNAEQLSTSDRIDDALEQVPGLSLFRRTNSVSANASIQG